MKDKKGFKILKFILNVIKYLFVLALIAFILVVCLQRFSNNKLSFFSYRIFAVVTNSMEPKYNVGDVLISKDLDVKDIKVGDTITYLGEKYNFKDKIITHQVVEIEKDENGKLLFRTKGLNNLVEDPIVKEDQVFGIVKCKSYILSTVYKIVDSNVGFYLFIVIPLFYIVGTEVIFTLKEKEEKRRKTN